MDAPGRPHVRIHEGFVYVERVPNYWVQVCLLDDYETMDDPARNFMISKAVKKAWDTQLPPRT